MPMPPAVKVMRPPPSVDDEVRVLRSLFAQARAQYPTLRYGQLVALIWKRRPKRCSPDTVMMVGRQFKER